MKIISINTWGGRIAEKLFKFIEENSSSGDIFIFQEVLKGGEGKTHREEIKSLYGDIEKLLSEYTGYFYEYGDGGYYSENCKDLDFKYGIATFVNKKLNQGIGAGIKLVDPTKEWGDYSGRFAAGAALSVTVEDYLIVNVHGLWQGSIKSDTEAKIEQSKRIVDLAESSVGQKIICGDFNLLPNTKSLEILSCKYQNLIGRYGIKDTRGFLYNKEIRYSDYIFVDNGINAKSFFVLDLQISDHLPLILEI